MEYQDINSKTIDRWVDEGWEWGRPIDHDTFVRAKNGEWQMLLTPVKPVPTEWFGELREKKILGLASGGGQQMPIFTALGAQCTVLDCSEKQLESERIVAEREDYRINIIRADMTKPLPFESESFDLIFHPVSNCYVRDICPIWKECYRILKQGGILLAGFDYSINYVFDDAEKEIINTLPFDPLKNPIHMKQLSDSDCGVQFSHSLEEEIGGQLKAGFRLVDLYEDIWNYGNLAEHNIPTFMATKAVKD